jgi:hypothetical protein
VISQTGCDFWNSTTLPYSYTLDPVSSLETIVKPNSGIPGSKVAILDAKDFAAPSSVTAPKKAMLVRTAFLGGKNVFSYGEVYDIYGRKIGGSSLRNGVKMQGVFIVNAKN